MNQHQSKLEVIQVLRAVAALMVVLLHLCGELMRHVDGLDKNYFIIGGSGVDIFFVISGFIICYTTRNTQSIKTFAIKRLARIIPLYSILTLGLFVILSIAPQFAYSSEASWPNLIQSLLFIPHEGPTGSVKPLLKLGWTLNYEMLFYTVFAVALLAGKWRILVASTVFLVAVAFGQFYQGNNVPLVFGQTPSFWNFCSGAASLLSMTNIQMLFGLANQCYFLPAGHF
ncbi:MAG: acyltransferase family protein [Alphaproteobacteria bacterium]